MSTFDEHCKTIRTIHVFLLAVCAGILLFALVPDHSAEMRASVKELLALNALPTQGFEKYIISQGNPYDKEDNHRVDIALRQIGIALSSPPPTFHESCYISNDWGGGDLEALSKFLVSHQTESCIHIAMTQSEIKKALAMQLSPFLPGASVKGLTSSTLSVQSFSPSPTGIQLLSMLPPPGDRRLKLEMALYDKSGRFISGGQDTELRFEMGPSRTHRYALRWLRSLQDEQILLKHATRKGDAINLLPASHNYWTDISQLGVAQALQYMQKRQMDSRRNLSVAGFTVDKATAFWVAPVLTTLILLYLLAHIRNLAGFVDYDGQSHFPWIGLFKDRLAAVTCYATILVIPLFSDLILIFKHPPYITFSLPTMITMATAMLGMLTSYELAKLRKKTFAIEKARADDGIC
jgi:hypothetical protein